MSKGQETRSAILDEALALASRVGFTGLTIGQLAEQTGMSKSGLFAHFQSKEQLQLQTLAPRRAQVHRHRSCDRRWPPRGARSGCAELFERWLVWETEALPGGCIFVDRLHRVRRPARRRCATRWSPTSATGSTPSPPSPRPPSAEGDFRADVDPRQVAFEIQAPDPRLPPRRATARRRPGPRPRPQRASRRSSSAPGSLTRPPLTERHSPWHLISHRKARSFVSGIGAIARLLPLRRAARAALAGRRARDLWFTAAAGDARRRRCPPAASRSRSPRRAPGPRPRLGRGADGLPRPRLGWPRQPVRRARRAAGRHRAPGRAVRRARARRLRPRAGRTAPHPRRRARPCPGRGVRRVRPGRGRRRALARRDRDLPGAALRLARHRAAGAARADGRGRRACSTSSRPRSASAPRTRRAFDARGRRLRRHPGRRVRRAATRPPTSSRCRPWSCTTAATGRRRTPARERLVAALPEARLVTTEGLGHRRILRDPAVIAQVVEFVGSRGPRGGRLRRPQAVRWWT